MDPGFLYIYKQDILDPRKIYKIGRTVDVFKRENDYKTISPFGRMMYARKCNNTSVGEQQILSALRLSFEVHGEVIVGADFETLKNHLVTFDDINKDDQSVMSNESSESNESSINCDDDMMVPNETWKLLSVEILKSFVTKYGTCKGKKDDLIQFLIAQNIRISNLIKPELQTFCFVYKLSLTGKKAELGRRLSSYLKKHVEPTVVNNLIQL